MSSPASGTSADLKQDAKRALPFAAMSGVLQILFSLVSMVLLVRYLPQEQYGVWAIVVGLGAPIMLFFERGQAERLVVSRQAEDRPASGQMTVRRRQYRSI